MYRLIFLDYSMPDLDGPQVARRIREIVSGSPALDAASDPYICCASAYSEAGFKKQAFEAGMN